MNATMRELTSERYPRAQRRPPAPPPEAIASNHPERNAALVAADATWEYAY